MNKTKPLEDYKEAGAWIRLCKDVLDQTQKAASKVLDGRDVALISKMHERIMLLSSRAEDKMLHDHPHFNEGATDVFFGNMQDSPRTDTDKEQIEHAQRNIINLFGDNWSDDLIEYECNDDPGYSKD